MRTGLGLVVLAIAGCPQAGSGDPSPTGAAAPSSPVQPVADAPVPTTPAGSATPDTRVTPVVANSKTVAPPSVVASPAAVAREWWVVAHRQGELAIGELADGTVVVLSEHDIATAAPGKPLSAAKPLTIDANEPVAEYGPSPPRPGQIESIGGRWPDDIRIVEVDHDPRAGSTWNVHRLAQDHWTRDDTSIDGVLVAVLDSFTPWTNGTTLARRTWRIDETAVPSDMGWEDDESGYERARATYDRKLKKALAGAKPSFVVLGGTADPPPAELAAMPGAFASFASGDVVLGCDESGAFTHRAADGTVRSVPMPPLENLRGELDWAQFVGRAPSELVCLRSSTTLALSRFDGTAWRSRPATKHDEPVRAASLGRDGPLWALFGSDRTVMVEGLAPNNTLRRLDAADAWETVDLSSAHTPSTISIAGIDPTQVVARSADDVWIAGVVPPAADGSSVHEATWVVLHSRAPSSVLALAR